MPADPHQLLLILGKPRPRTPAPPHSTDSSPASAPGSPHRNDRAPAGAPACHAPRQARAPTWPGSASDRPSRTARTGASPPAAPPPTATATGRSQPTTAPSRRADRHRDRLARDATAALSTHTTPIAHPSPLHQSQDSLHTPGTLPPAPTKPASSNRRYITHYPGSLATRDRVVPRKESGFQASAERRPLPTVSGSLGGRHGGSGDAPAAWDGQPGELRLRLLH